MNRSQILDWQDINELNKDHSLSPIHILSIEQRSSLALRRTSMIACEIRLTGALREHSKRASANISIYNYV